MTLPQFFFFYNSTVIILSALFMVTRKNPVHSALLMLVMFFHIASVYLFLNAEFVAALQVVVYAGAILVLFLFVIFLLNLKADNLLQKNMASWPTAAVLALSMFVIIAISVKDIKVGPGRHSIEQLNSDFGVTGISHVKAIGALLYTQFIYPFEVASLILLVAMVGAIVLAKKRI